MSSLLVVVNLNGKRGKLAAVSSSWHYIGTFVGFAVIEILFFNWK